MPSVALRDYLKELEDLQRAGQYDEVIGHSQHILRHFPKNIATYRLLGNTMLARRNFAEAAEMFRRVLSASPYDFDAHMGLSMVAEHNNQLDAAIWHLERALEVAPNDQRIVQRVQSLYQRRDNKPPDKIQMTRVGLAHQYMNAQLYDQAIAELRDAVEKAPRRYDLKMLLAEALFEAQHYVEAGEISLEILDALPNFLPANKLMARLWLAQKRPEDAKPFIERVEALAPYESASLVSGQENVSTNAFVIPKLDWNATTLAAQSSATLDWMSDFGDVLTSEKGLATADDWGDEGSEEAPDWFAPGADFEEPAAPLEDTEDATDWFKSMGTAPLTPPQQPESDLGDIPLPGTDLLGQLDSLPMPETSAESMEFADAEFDIPDFLGGNASADEIALPTTSEFDAGFMSESEETVIAPLSAFDEQQFEQNVLHEPDEITPPSWLPTPAEDEFGLEEMGMETDQMAVSWLQPPSEQSLDLEDESENLPDWMQAPQEEIIELSTPSQNDEFEGELEWLMTDEFNEPEISETPSQEPTPDWINPVSEETDDTEVEWLTAEEAEPELSTPLGMSEADMDWLSGGVEIEPEAEMNWLAPDADSIPQIEEESPAWLSEATPVDMNETTTDGGMDWLGNADAGAADWLADMGETDTDSDSVEMDWLGASQESEPVASETPDWLSSASVGDDSDSAEADWLADMSDTETDSAEANWLGTSQESEPVASETPDWLSSASVGDDSDSEEADWLADMSDTETESAPEMDWLGASQEPEPVASDDSDSAEADWLADMSETDTESAPEANWLGANQESEPVASETPDWLGSASVSEDSDSAEADWLADMSETDTESAPEMDWLGANQESEPVASETPDWLGSASVGEDSDSAEADWLADMGETETESASEMDWLGASQESEPVASDDPDSAEADWLADMGETETASEMDWLGANQESEPVASETPDWLGSASVGDDSDSAEADWLADMGETETDSAEANWLGAGQEPEPVASETPDWLGSASVSDEAGEADWLADMSDTETDSAEANWLGAGQESEPVASETPDWLSSASVSDDSDSAEADWLGANRESEPVASETPDWLSNASVSDEVEAEQSDSIIVESSEAAEADWLSEIEIEEDDTELDWLADSAQEEQPVSTLPEWLNEDAEEPLIDVTESVLDTSDEDEEIPEWLTEDEEEIAVADTPSTTKLPSWMAAFSDEEEEVEEKTSELNAFLADFVDPGAAEIGALRPVVAQQANLADNKVSIEEEEDEGAFDFNFSFEFEKAPAWMRGKEQQPSKPSFAPRWMRGKEQN